ncbi:hypothetical protein [Mesorhizobium sp. A623]
MMMLGDILALARRSGTSFQGWLVSENPDLAARIDDAAAREASDFGGYIGLAVSDFTEHASAEDWATLTSRLRNSDDPGRACIESMIKWRLAATGTDAAPAHQGA